MAAPRLSTPHDGAPAHEAGYDKRARIYDVEYATTVDQDFLRSLLTEQVRSVLEVPCGSGRNLDWLVDSGRRVLCADLEPAMVRRVSEHIAESEAGSRVSAVQADMCTLALGREFDLILVPQEAFQLVADADDAERALARLAEHLAPGGTLLLDLHTFGTDTAHGDSALPDYFDPSVDDGVTVKEWRRPVTQSQWLERSRSQHGEGARMRIDYFYRLGEGSRVLDEWRSSILMRRYSEQGIREMAARAGMRINRMARDYDGTPWVSGASRMISLLSRTADRKATA